MRGKALLVSNGPVATIQFLLGHGENHVDFRILDDNGFNLVPVILENPVQETLERLFITQKRLESRVVKRVEVLVFLDFFDGLIDPLLTIEIPIGQTDRHDAFVF